MKELLENNEKEKFMKEIKIMKYEIIDDILRGELILLYYVVIKGNKELIKCLLELGVSFSKKIYDIIVFCRIMLEKLDLDLIEYCLNNGVEINVLENECIIVFVYICYNSNYDIIKLLMKYNLDYNIIYILDIYGEICILECIMGNINLKLDEKLELLGEIKYYFDYEIIERVMKWIKNVDIFIEL